MYYGHRSSPQKGSVLIAVLAIIVLLSFMVTRFIDEAVEDLEYQAIFNEPADARAFAYSMLEATLATIQEVALIDDGNLYAPEQGWSDPISYAGIEVPSGWEVTVQIQDEGGKLPLNTMSEAILNRLLEETLDIGFGETRELSSTLADWIDSDDTRRLNGAESDEYLLRSPPYKAANRPLQSLDELKLLNRWDEIFFDEEGQPNELFEQLSNLVSVQNSGQVNINSAPAEVLEVLSLEEGWEDDSLFDGLEEPYRKEAPAGAQTSGVTIGLLRITVRLLRGDVPLTIDALVEPAFTSASNPPSGPSGPVAPNSPSPSGNTPGSAGGDEPKTGSSEEQEAINYPFKILHLSEYTRGNKSAPAARHSAVDISL